MENNDFCLYLSQKEGSEAAKEISLKIKSNTSVKPSFIFILFTPGYQSQDLLKTFNFTLKSSNLLGIKAPFLIYKGQIIKTGVVCCWVNKKDSRFKVFFTGEKDSEKIEDKFRLNFKTLKKKEINLLSFLSPQINPLSFLEGLRLSLGRLSNFAGAGFDNKNCLDKHFMINAGVGSGLASLNLKGIQAKKIYLHNFIPLGKQFDITKINFKQKIIHEINNKPAVEIYRHYLEENFSRFIQNRLFHYYPLGIPGGDSTRLLVISDILEDGSLVFKGNLRHKVLANIMILKEKYSREEISKELRKNDIAPGGIAFIISSLDRKKNLGKAAEAELKNIQKAFSPSKEVFGLFSDYYFFSDNKNQDMNIESGGFIINAWN